MGPPAMTKERNVSQRCGQPGQQQGRRFPSWRFSQPQAIRRVLVSAFLADVIQQIHSLRASGVMSSHVARALALAMRAFFRSAGRSWTTPPEIFFALWTVIPTRPTIAVLARQIPSERDVFADDPTGFQARLVRCNKGLAVLNPVDGALFSHEGASPVSGASTGEQCRGVDPHSDRAA